ncbi:hypothetical protein PPMP20_28175 [Paraburkholderia phymatum]|uniref:Uncharacterized protein n=1 Tax=Paraburkholderia phymatum (strain DSM 17167 / CIP 108236 / LMG 21445 / STM815) TaxID=391038 RepID=B2JNM4_PARP8|nr:hypothetical protein [Paraburkholderia phymatum]ACC72975.1 conserved hypothetical protein [Paraburkholderia phymatum STM815]
MSALMIKDLSVTEQLDSKAMKAVRGGFVAYPYFPSLKLDFDNSKTVSAQQLVNQGLNIDNVSDNNNAFVSHLPTTIKPTMTAKNNVTVS